MEPSPTSSSSSTHTATTPLAIPNHINNGDNNNSIMSTSSSRIMASSISSLSSARHSSSSHITKTYRQASTLFLTRRLPEALSTVLPLITPPTPEDPNTDAFEPAPVARASRSTRIKVWSLYLTVLNAILELDSEEGKQAFGTQEWRALCTKVRDGHIWEEVVHNGYHDVEGNVDADVVINLATILLAHAKTQAVSQKRLENYLAAARTPNLDISSDRFGEPSARRLRSPAKGTGGADTPRDLNARVKILEIYTLHVLPRNNEWAYAHEFISMSAVLDDERREAFLQALQSLQEDQREAERREAEERREQEERIRKDIEEARRLRAENEERERKRLEEERARRQRAASSVASTEGDYGVEVGGPVRTGRPVPGQPKSSVRAVPPPTAGRKGKAVVGPPSLGKRATMVFSNLRALVDQMSASVRMNPFVLYRTLAFVIGLLLMFSRKSIRDRVNRVLGTSWDKIRTTAGMGVKVDNLGTPVPVLLQARALEAVKGVRDALAAAHDALVLVVAEAALVADAHQCRRPHVRVAHGALAVALVAEAADGDAGLLAAHDEIAGGRERPPSAREGQIHPDRRLSTDAPKPPSPPPRKNPSQEEKKRGQRLFGGLLSTLSQTTSNSQQKRRLEIERRQKERAHQQRADDQRRRVEKQRKLDHAHRLEQVEFDEQRMRTRHANMLVLARSLRTKSVPRLYYRPWALTKEQERIVDDQVGAVKERIDREVEEFEDQKVKRLRDLGIHRPPPRQQQQNTVGEPNNLPPKDANRRASASSKVQHVDKLDGDAVVPSRPREGGRLWQRQDLVPNDPRVTHHTTTLNGHKWHYLVGVPPSSPPVATILLVHGHPDLAFGWRYQVPHLLSLNLRVIVPDMLGYGDTDAPEDVAEYSHRKICASLAALIRHVLPEDPTPRVFLGGHDWGGAVVWKFAALWHPEMVRGVFSVCTPYGAPMQGEVYPGLEALVEKVPNFRYQLQLAGEELEGFVTREGLVGGYVGAVFGAKPEGDRGRGGVMTPEGVVLERLRGVKGGGRAVGEGEWRVYEEAFKKKGLRGPLNWYRTGRVNFEEERGVAAEGPERWRIKAPAMLISAKRDPFLPPRMSANMDRWFDDLAKHEVDTSHWALWEAPEEVNRYIGEFLKRVLAGEKPLKASI
ncbi:hypothetical protein QBC39DRAFT_428564 [Podospora conica]|nr:hypothetical protein QBC39DRAFT_428564 [Schizothecium conicum]